MELQRWKIEEEKKLEEARISEEAAMTMVEMEKEKCRAAMKAAEASHRIAALEAQKRMNAERKSETEAVHRKKADDTFGHGSAARYRRYTIEEIEEATKNFSDSLKIGEGGYGPVFKCELDHTQVAIKVLKSDAAQGRAQFQQEVCMTHFMIQSFYIISSHLHSLIQLVLLTICMSMTLIGFYGASRLKC